MRDLAHSGSIRYVEAIAQSLIVEGGEFRGVRVKRTDGQLEDLDADHVLTFFGLHPKLGPIAEWGLTIDKRAIVVDTEKFQTNIPGVFAVGDINTYPGKKKLILSGFHEAALAAFAVAAHLNPTKKIPPAVHDDESRSCISGSACRIERASLRSIGRDEPRDG